MNSQLAQGHGKISCKIFVDRNKQVTQQSPRYLRHMRKQDLSLQVHPVVTNLVFGLCLLMCRLISVALRNTTLPQIYIILFCAMSSAFRNLLMAYITLSDAWNWATPVMIKGLKRRRTANRGRRIDKIKLIYLFIISNVNFYFFDKKKYTGEGVSQVRTTRKKKESSTSVCGSYKANMQVWIILTMHLW